MNNEFDNPIILNDRFKISNISRHQVVSQVRSLE